MENTDTGGALRRSKSSYRWTVFLTYLKSTHAVNPETDHLGMCYHHPSMVILDMFYWVAIDSAKFQASPVASTLHVACHIMPSCPWTEQSRSAYHSESVKSCTILESHVKPQLDPVGISPSACDAYHPITLIGLDRTCHPPLTFRWGYAINL